MSNTGFDISRIEGEITVSLKAADPYGLVQASVLALGALLTNNTGPTQVFESACLFFAGTSRHELLTRLWVELLFFLRQEQLNLVRAVVAEFSDSRLDVECHFSPDFTLGTLLLGPEWLTGEIAVPVCTEANGAWVARVVWKAAGAHA
ncbi:MAG: hypothetical protein LBO05_07870 [Deltaproteobacteria bacterium]|jgi:hypothetical protein|nr:hypothetical protein [Deltaproteobacteria bacterium]